MKSDFKFPTYLHEFEETFDDDYSGSTRCSRGYKGLEMQLSCTIGDDVVEEMDFDSNGKLLRYKPFREGKCLQCIARFPSTLLQDLIDRRHNVEGKYFAVDELEACWYAFKTLFADVGSRLVQIHRVEQHSKG